LFVIILSGGKDTIKNEILPHLSIAKRGRSLKVAWWKWRMPLYAGQGRYFFREIFFGGKKP